MKRREVILSGARATRFYKVILSGARATRFYKVILSGARATRFYEVILNGARATRFYKVILSGARSAEPKDQKTTDMILRLVPQGHSLRMTHKGVTSKKILN